MESMDSISPPNSDFVWVKIKETPVLTVFPLLSFNIPENVKLKAPLPKEPLVTM